MFIKLTRLNGSPLWLNPEFILRIEPWKAGALVVPAGDDLDYEVRETPAQLLAQLGLMAPVAAKSVAAPVPVPAPVATPPPAPVPAPVPVPASASEPAPASVPPPAPEESADASAPETPKKRTRKTTTRKTTKKTAEPVPPAPVAEAPTPAHSITVAPAASEGEDVVAATAARLKRHGCKSEKKILNSLKSMFRRKSDEEIVALLQQMEDRGLVTLDDHGHATFA